METRLRVCLPRASEAARRDGWCMSPTACSQIVIWDACEQINEGTWIPGPFLANTKAASLGAGPRNLHFNELFG